MEKTNYFRNKIIEFEQKPDSEVLEFLLNHWQIEKFDKELSSFKLMAKYKKNESVDRKGNSFGFFYDVRNLNGDLLYYPFGRIPVTVFTIHNSAFEKESYWLINVKLASPSERMKRHNPFLLQAANQIVGKPSVNLSDRLSKEDLTRKIFSNTGATERDAKNTAGSLRLIMADLYENEDDRFVYELLQNADDFPLNGSNVSVKIKLLDEHLIFAHSGRPFSEKDVESICSINDSTKSSEENTIGYKGIGFKSVFSDNVETVFVNSGNFSFAFDKQSPIYKGEDMKNIPWQIKPIWEEKYRLPKEVQGEDNFFKMPVAFAINIGDERERYDRAISMLLSASKFLLFLRHVNLISYSNGQKTITITKDREDDRVIIETDAEDSVWVTNHYVVPIPDEIRHELQTERAIPQKLKQVTSTEIIFAAELKDNKIIRQQSTSLFSYLPTRVREFNFPFVVNADFLTTASRESIHTKSVWNKFLFKAIGEKCLHFIASLIVHDDYLKVLVSEFLSEENALSIDFNEQYRIALKKEAFILNHNRTLSKQSEIIIDKTGLSKIIGAEFFCKLLGTEKLLPSENIDNSVLEEKIFDEIGKFVFDDVIAAITDNAEFNQWFVSADDGQRARLYEWIDEKHTEGRDSAIRLFVSHLPLFHFETNSGNVDVSANQIKTNNDFYASSLAHFPDEGLQYLHDNDHDGYIREVEKRESQFRDVYYDGTIIRPCFYCIISSKNLSSVERILSKIWFHHVFNIDLGSLHFVFSKNEIGINHPLYKYIDEQDNKQLFDAIKQCDFSSLGSDERKMLFFTLKDLPDIGPAKLKEIALFRNINGKTMPLKELMDYRDGVAQWLRDYVLCQKDSDERLKEYLVGYENEFEEIVWKHRDEFGVPITELFASCRWSDPKYTKELIEQHKREEKLSVLLPIIEDASCPATMRQYYLDNISKIDLLPDSFYGTDSWEYRVLQMAVSVYEDISTFASKIFFEGQCIKSFAVLDEVVCEYDYDGGKKKVKFSLSKLLPQYQVQSSAINKVKELFESKKNLDKFFDAKPMSLVSIKQMLEDGNYLGLSSGEWVYNKGGNAYQYLFFVYYYCGYKRYADNSSYIIRIQLEKESDDFVNEMMDFLYSNKIAVWTSPFTRRIRQYFSGKYFDNTYIFETERLLPSIEKWAGLDDEKKEYLYANGVRRLSDDVIKFRQLFQNNEQIDFINKMSNVDKASCVRFVAESNIYTRPFVGEHQKTALLSMIESKECNLIWKWDYAKIVDDSHEWDSAKYKEWREKLNPYIYIYPGELPMQLIYKGECLISYTDGSCPFYYDLQSRRWDCRLYISDTRKIDELLFEIAKNTKVSFSFDDYKFLCLDGKISVSEEELLKKDKTIDELSKSNLEKEEIIKRYKEKFGDLGKLWIADNELDGNEIYGLDTDQSGESNLSLHTPNKIVLEKGNVDRQAQEEFNKETRIKVKKYLSDKRYDVSAWEPTKSLPDLVDVIKDPAGNLINIVIRSAKQKIIHLSASSFEVLMSRPNNLLVVENDKGIHCVSFTELFGNNNNVNLIFDARYTPREYFQALGTIFKYVKGTEFVVRDPNYSAFDEIRGFGLEVKNDGTVLITDNLDNI